MKTSKPYYFACLAIAILVVACGGGGGAGVPLSEFPDMKATEGDAPITLKAPQSKSPATFTYSSSDPKVATISGNTLTVLLAGTTTITAAQPSMGTYNPTSISALLTVSPRVCTAPTINQGGVCVTPVTCTAPSSIQNGKCVAPATAATFVTQNGHTWMPVTFADTWDNANAFCNSSTINGQTGWKLPTQFDLTELYASGAMNGQGWTLGQTWSSSPSVAAPSYASVNLANGAVQSSLSSAGAYVTCIR